MPASRRGAVGVLCGTGPGRGCRSERPVRGLAVGVVELAGPGHTLGAAILALRSSRWRFGAAGVGRPGVVAAGVARLVSSRLVWRGWCGAAGVARLV